MFQNTRVWITGVLLLQLCPAVPGGNQVLSSKTIMAKYFIGGFKKKKYVTDY